MTAQVDDPEAAGVASTDSELNRLDKSTSSVTAFLCRFLQGISAKAQG